MLMLMAWGCGSLLTLGVTSATRLSIAGRSRSALAILFTGYTKVWEIAKIAALGRRDQVGESLNRYPLSRRRTEGKQTIVLPSKSRGILLSSLTLKSN
jgi:hypothetical protein